MVLILNIILLVLFVAGAVWTMMTTRLLHSAVGLAFTSAVLTVLMFQLDSPLAAVFELSVCSGLVSAIFISTIMLTKRVTAEELIVRRKIRMAYFWFLPIVVVAAAIVLSLTHIPVDFKLPEPPVENNVKNIMWNVRHLDLLGQIAILLTGVFGVVTLFKESKHD
jgi:NADH-quinone oxidoreductase subunit J